MTAPEVESRVREGVRAATAAAERVSRALDRSGLPLVPVHGDAHLRNVISTAQGPARPPRREPCATCAPTRRELDGYCRALRASVSQNSMRSSSRVEAISWIQRLLERDEETTNDDLASGAVRKEGLLGGRQHLADARDGVAHRGDLLKRGLRGRPRAAQKVEQAV
jgi:hypothetical protein